jgi:hypothetical protein
VIIDLTTLEKRGKFKAYEELMQVLNGKRGLQLVVLYLVIGRWRFPWNVRVWRGKGTATPAQLAIRLLRSLPPALSRAFRVMVMADTAFGSVEFLSAVRQLGYSAIVGVREDRKLSDGRQLWDLHKRGQQVQLQGLPFAVSISWFYLERKGKLDKRYVLSTRPTQGQYDYLVGQTPLAERGLFQNDQASVWIALLWSRHNQRHVPLAATGIDCFYPSSLGVSIDCWLNPARLESRRSSGARDAVPAVGGVLS